MPIRKSSFLFVVLALSSFSAQADSGKTIDYDEYPHLHPRYQGQFADEPTIDNAENAIPQAESKKSRKPVLPGVQAAEERKLPKVNLSRMSDRQLLEAIYLELYIQKNK